MKTITIPPHATRDERDALIRHAITQIALALRRIDRLKQKGDAVQPARPNDDQF